MLPGSQRKKKSRRHKTRHAHNTQWDTWSSIKLQTQDHFYYHC